MTSRYWLSLKDPNVTAYVSLQHKWKIEDLQYYIGSLAYKSFSHTEMITVTSGTSIATAVYTFYASNAKNTENTTHSFTIVGII